VPPPTGGVAPQTGGTHRPHVLITDAMPVNGGDEALVMGLRRALRRRWPSARFTMLCHRADESRRLLPDAPIEPAMETDDGIETVERFYRRADLVISTPGGFLHEHYDITAALRGFQLALDLNTPLVLFAQSMGPFTTPALRRQVADVLQRAALVAVRDSLSLHHLADCGVQGDHVVRVPDAVFLWRRLARSLYVAKSGPPRRAALCFRRWPSGDREAFRDTVKKARHLVEHLRAEGIEEFLFVSTCQGVPAYIDDSELAERMVEGLAAPLRDRCIVNRERLHPEEMIRLLSGCDVMFSMRLHGCLLAMLGGTPAMGLAYESKTPEIFRQLGLKAYQLPFTAYATRWCECASRLLADLDPVRAALPDALDRMSGAVHRGLDRLDAVLTAS
jgi:polysaccharide pyruvyl transferase WcaK-like protein